MGKDVFRKGMILGIIMLFVGTNVVPNISVSGDDLDNQIAPGILEHCSERKLARTSDGTLHCVYFRLEGSYHRIYYSYSTNEGITWTEEPEPLSPPSQDCRHPCVAVDQDDNIHVAWSWWRAPAGPSWHATIQYRVKTANWQEIEPNVITGYHDHPSLAIDSEGVVHLAVGGHGGGAYHCARVQYLKKVTPSSDWSTPPYPVSSSCWAALPELVVDKDDNIHVLYAHSPKYGPYYGLRYRKKVGGDWEGEETVQEDDEHWSCGSMALDSDGNVYVVYNNHDTGCIKIRKRTSGGWQTPGDVYLPDGYSQHSPVVSIDKNNNIHVVWSGKHVNSPNCHQIRYREYPLDGSPPQDITCALVDQENPNLIWAWWPVVDDVSTNIPKTGFAFVWNDGPIIKFYKSADLEWDDTSNKPTIPYKKASRLARKVIDAPYLWGGKGFDLNERRFVSCQDVKKKGYNYWNPLNQQIEYGRGLDCSGLVYWAYNRAYFGGKILGNEEFENRPVYYEGADGQYRYNTNPIDKEDLLRGDILFFDESGNDGIMDHVAMYVGIFHYKGMFFNVVHASGFTGVITPAILLTETNKLYTFKSDGSSQVLTVDGYGRVKWP